MEMIVDIVVSLMNFILVLTRPFSEPVIDAFYRIIYPKKTLPPILNKILLMSATTLAQKIRRREVSAVEVMNAYIGRIGEVQPVINACVDNRFEEALADARAVDAMLGEGGKSEAELEAQLPLLGVPFSCKEMIGVQNLAQTFGLKSLKDRKAPEDSDTAALYRRAGAIPVVVTNIPTMSLWWDTYNPVFGTTCNPHDTNRSVGGSSGGEAALIASAGSIIGIGNDLGGSIRLPASLCGIYGHKPSQGIISNETHSPFKVPAIEPFLSTGPMCRYVEDLPQLVSVLSGQDKKKLRLDEKVNITDIKVYYMEELPGYLLSATPDIKRAVRKILEFVTKCLWVFFALTRPFSDRVLDLVYRVLAGKPAQLPPVKSKILLMSATELAKAIRKKKITSEKVVSTYIERIREVDPIINACVDQRFGDAVEDARRIDEILKVDLKTEGEIERELPLLGVPFTCKEILGVKGLAQTMGLRRFQDRTAPADAETVALYKKAGAIPLMVTNIPTISMWWQTSNALFGMTTNPYNSHRMVGGSSGGEAAAIASGASVIGIGTDIGGSIRIPACFCGIYGHKPSRGIISNHRPTPGMNMKVDPFRSTGPMCRYAQDLPLLVKILIGEEGAKKLHFDKMVDFTKINLFYMEGFPGFLSPIPAIQSAVRKAVQYFEDKFGIRANRLEAEELASAFDIWMYKFLEADGSPLLPDLADQQGNMDWPREMLRSLLGRSEYDIPILYFAAIGKRRKDRRYFRCLDLFRKLEEKIEECLQGDTLLLVPTFPELPPHTKMSIPKVENTAYTSIFNSLGCPSTQVPAGLVGGLPIGVQAVASRCNDRLTLAAAVELEKLFGGWKSPCATQVKA